VHLSHACCYIHRPYLKPRKLRKADDYADYIDEGGARKLQKADDDADYIDEGGARKLQKADDDADYIDEGGALGDMGEEPVEPGVGNSAEKAAGADECMAPSAPPLQLFDQACIPPAPQVAMHMAPPQVPACTSCGSNVGVAKFCAG